MTGNSGGPGGRGGGGGNKDDRNRPNGNGGDDRRPRNDGPQMPPELDDMLRKGQEQLKVLLGGGSGGGSNGSSQQSGPGMGRSGYLLIAALLVAFWSFSSFYTVKPAEKSVELFLGNFSSIGNPGLNFAPWPLVTRELFPVTRHQNASFVVGARGIDAALMLPRALNFLVLFF